MWLRLKPRAGAVNQPGWERVLPGALLELRIPLENKAVGSHLGNRASGLEVVASQGRATSSHTPANI